MAQAMYKVFLAKPTEAWYQLSDDERNQLDTKVTAALEQVGGRRIVLCASSWASEQWPFWGVEEFPNLEAVQRHTQLLSELNWFRYLESVTLLGTEWQPE